MGVKGLIVLAVDCAVTKTNSAVSFVCFCFVVLRFDLERINCVRESVLGDPVRSRGRKTPITNELRTAPFGCDVSTCELVHVPEVHDCVFMV